MTEDPRTVVRVTDTTTQAEIEAALTACVHTLHRWPSHWTSQRDRMHARIDALLEDWERAGAQAG